MTAKRLNIEFDGHQYFLVIDKDNERCLARLDTRMDALAWLEIYKMLSEENEQLKDALNQRTDQCDKYYKENEQLKSFIKKLTNRNGEILLMNGYGYTKSYVEKLLNEKELEE